MSDNEITALENRLRELNQERSQVLARLTDLQKAKIETVQPLGQPARSTAPVTPDEKLE